MHLQATQSLARIAIGGGAFSSFPLNLQDMKITGTITYEDISGGFWGIIADDGRKFRPVSPIPRALQKVGQRVTATVEDAPGYSIFMWGKEVEVKHIEALHEDDNQIE